MHSYDSAKAFHVPRLLAPFDRQVNDKKHWSH